MVGIWRSALLITLRNATHIRLAHASYRHALLRHPGSVYATRALPSPHLQRHVCYCYGSRALRAAHYGAIGYWRIRHAAVRDTFGKHSTAVTTLYIGTLRHIVSAARHWYQQPLVTVYAAAGWYMP